MDLRKIYSNQVTSMSLEGMRYLKQLWDVVLKQGSFQKNILTIKTEICPQNMKVSHKSTK